MKLSISLPDSMAKEIKKLAKKSERQVSWIIQNAWQIAAPKMGAIPFSGSRQALKLRSHRLAGKFDKIDVRKAAYE